MYYCPNSDLFRCFVVNKQTHVKDDVQLILVNTHIIASKVVKGRDKINYQIDNDILKFY